MRFFSVFFAVYIALLACLPCADKAPAWAFGSRTQVEATEHGAGSHTNLDWCSPLCQCQCCAGAVVASLGSKPLGLTPPVLEWPVHLRHAPLLVGTPTHAPGAVWQPPQA